MATKIMWELNPDEPQGLIFGDDSTRVQPLSNGAYEWTCLYMHGRSFCLGCAMLQALDALREQMRTPSGWLPLWVPTDSEARVICKRGLEDLR